MKMFSDCSGECCICDCGGFCLAGHGDDDFCLASKEKIIENLDKGKYPTYTEYMKSALKQHYNYDYVTCDTMNIAVYPGSFAPFTNGHLHVAKQASKIFDKVFIVISTNTRKPQYKGMEKMKEAVEYCLKRENLQNVFVEYSAEMTGDFCKKVNAKFIVRGLRNTQDFLNEEIMAKTNNALYTDVETIYMRAKDDIVSSSMVRELLYFGKDISEYVPKEVLDLVLRSI